MGFGGHAVLVQRGGGKMRLEVAESADADHADAAGGQRRGGDFLRR